MKIFKKFLFIAFVFSVYELNAQAPYFSKPTKLDSTYFLLTKNGEAKFISYSSLFTSMGLVLDPSITNEGSLTLAAATTNSTKIVSNTSSSTDIEIFGDDNTIIGENVGANQIVISANQPILVHLTPLSFTDSLKTTGVKSGDYFTIPAAYDGYIIKSVVYGVRTASSGSGDVVIGLNIYNNSAPRGTSFVNALSATFSAGEVEEVIAGGGLTVSTGQLIVPNISTDTAVTHALGLTISIVLQPL